MLADFIDFPIPPPTLNKDCIATFKICKITFKYSISLKGNLNHHISSAHMEINNYEIWIFEHFYWLYVHDNRSNDYYEITNNN